MSFFGFCTSFLFHFRVMGDAQDKTMWDIRETETNMTVFRSCQQLFPPHFLPFVLTFYLTTSNKNFCKQHFSKHLKKKKSTSFIAPSIDYSFYFWLNFSYYMLLQVKKFPESCPIVESQYLKLQRSQFFMCPLVSGLFEKATCKVVFFFLIKLLSIVNKVTISRVKMFSFTT